jgi:hypothetical protein
MMPRIEASETLSAINVAALAAGAGEPHDRARIFDGLERKAAGGERPAAAKAEPADLAGMGIGMKAAEGEQPVITDLGAWLGNVEQDHG